jgi:hypothetical protein
MLPNLRSMIVAIIASILGISFGLGLFAVFRVNRDPILDVPGVAQPLLGFSSAEPIVTSSVINAAATSFDSRFTLPSPFIPSPGRSIAASAPAPTARAEPVGASLTEANAIIVAAEPPENPTAYSADTIAEIANAEVTPAEAAKAEVANTDATKAKAAKLDATKAEMTTKAEARLDVTSNEATKTEINVDGSNTEATKTDAKLDVTNNEATKAEASKTEVANSEVTNAQTKADVTNREVTKVDVNVDVATTEATKTDAKADDSNTEVSKAQASKSEVANTDARKAETAKADVISAEVTKAEAGDPDVANIEVAKPEAKVNDTNSESIKAEVTKPELASELTSGDRKAPVPRSESVVETSTAEQSLAISETGQKTVRPTSVKVHAKTADAKVHAKKANTTKVRAKSARSRVTHTTVKSQQAGAQQLTGFGQFDDQGFAAQPVYQYSQTQVAKPVRIRRTSRHRSSG